MDLEYFKHDSAIVEVGARIGNNTRIWAFAHVLAGAQLGSHCNICDHVFIENDVVMGDRVTVKSGVQLWDCITIEDDCFIGPNVTFTNDIRPRSKRYLTTYPRTVLRQGCSIGGNATILPGVLIGRWAMIGAGAVVIREVPDFGLVYGNPGRLRGWVCRCGKKLEDFTSGESKCSCGVAYQMKEDKTIEFKQNIS